MSHYIRLLNFFYDVSTEEEFRKKANECVEFYIKYRKKHG
ncbi:hypothetical protein BACOV975_03029 [Bacteroides ovatus V975]|uniref:Uncharacterized protein n=1 Tax=Bacteroides ovatus (strain ATCC 8483 / DSM 1896 / JCM 5824 / BCRC 10623 / CCUG 4943 / NCTC 11153) TaxID=411476 RepID=A0AAN3DA21_BACO1|nr:hypothetical protein BACOVA_01732 [Bacteroides ovatus ATCC 8483]CAG9889893.1 hypothetical protein BOVA713_215 [Bacteroides ovatus]SCV09235.1 hypothetical protein BACOV975_03029 [Bacteroides ovatus V975]